MRVQLLNKGLLAKYTFDDILGQSSAIKQCKDMACRMAGSDSAILITSESGTGKELFAQGIHNASKRQEYQFVAVNCAALSESLLESELFGYEGGAFTGAKKEGRTGLFELAHNGTLFLDEIGDMPLLLQARLLRTLQEKTVMRIGGESVINVNVRIICATNRDLKKLVNQGLFRKDLYFRISVLPLVIPPLRERTEDIPILVQKFMKEYDSDFLLTDSAVKAMEQYGWPGNVRELRNYVEYFSNIGKEIIEVSDLPFFNIEEINVQSGWKRSEEFSADSAVQAFQHNTGDLNGHLAVLKILDESYRLHRRMGRRSLSQMASEMGLYLSEQEIRSILLKLESYGFVEIKKGRAGTKITEAGRSALQQILLREKGGEL
ncbi:MAG TPA: sigma 54-interacting transcriptional regulator [Bacillota bacterium]|nr:sigma 54-interacting transcriptional regulator [Bacillota bacterium]